MTSKESNVLEIAVYSAGDSYTFGQEGDPDKFRTRIRLLANDDSLPNDDDVLTSRTLGQSDIEKAAAGAYALMLPVRKTTFPLPGAGSDIFFQNVVMCGWEAFLGRKATVDHKTYAFTVGGECLAHTDVSCMFSEDGKTDNFALDSWESNVELFFWFQEWSKLLLPDMKGQLEAILSYYFWIGYDLAKEYQSGLE